MEKERLVGFIAKVLEESGFKTYTNFKAKSYLIDVYGVLPTLIGDFTLVVNCKNYDNEWKVGLDIIKETEMMGKTLKASKTLVLSTTQFTPSAVSYANLRNIDIINRDELTNLARQFSEMKKNGINPMNSIPFRGNEYTDNYEEPIEEGELEPELEKNEGMVTDYRHVNERHNTIEEEDSGVIVTDDYDTDEHNGVSSAFYGTPRNKVKHDFTPSTKNKTPKNPFTVGKKENKKLPKLGKNLHKNKSHSHNKNKIRTSKSLKTPSEPFLPKFKVFTKKLLSNIISQIITVMILVILISLLWTYLDVNQAIIGIMKLLLCAVFSYSIVWYAKRDSDIVIMNGTIVFFVSLLLSIAMIFIGL